MIRGTDVSLHQPIDLPWQSWKQIHDLRYMIARLTIGYLMDEEAYIHIDKARQANILVGGYHLLMAFHPEIGAYDPVRQAKAFLSVLDRSKVKVAMLDIEVANLTTDTVTKWCDYYDANCNLPLIMYGNTWYLNQLLRPAERFSKYYVMIAAYGPGTPTSNPPAGNYPFPEIWKNQPNNKKFWQFAGDNGRLSPYTGRIDLSQYLGTEQELQTLFSGALPPDEELSMGQKEEIAERLSVIDSLTAEIREIMNETPEVIPLFRIRIKPGVTVNIRSGPAVTFTDIGDAKAGEEYSVYEERSGWYKLSHLEERWMSGNILYSEKI